MNMFGTWIDATISASGSDTGEVDLENQYDEIALMIPEMDECQLSLKVAEKTTAQGGTYYDLGRDTTTADEKFNRADVWKIGGWRFIKIVSSVAQSAERTIRLRGIRY